MLCGSSCRQRVSQVLRTQGLPAGGRSGADGVDEGAGELPAVGRFVGGGGEQLVTTRLVSQPDLTPVLCALARRRAGVAGVEQHDQPVEVGAVAQQLLQVLGQVQVAGGAALGAGVAGEEVEVVAAGDAMAHQRQQQHRSLGVGGLESPFERVDELGQGRVVQRTLVGQSGSARPQLRIGQDLVQLVSERGQEAQAGERVALRPDHQHPAAAHLHTVTYTCHRYTNGGHRD